MMRLLLGLLLGLAMGLPVQSWAAVAVEGSVTTGEDADGNGVISVNHTAAGSNRAAVILVGAFTPAARTWTSCTYGGASATELLDVNETDSNAHTIAAYVYVAPATSSQEVVCTLSGAENEMFIAVIGLSGVDQSTPTGNVQTTFGFSADPSLTVTGVTADDMVFDVLKYPSFSTETIGANQTLRASIDGGSFSDEFRVSSQQNGTDGAMTWTFSTDKYHAYGAFVVKASGGSPTPTSFFERRRYQ